MSEVKRALRLVSVAKELNVGTGTIVELLQAKGFDVENKPTVKLTEEMHDILLKEYQKDAAIKEKAEKISLGHSDHEDVAIGDKKSSAPKKTKESEEILIKSTGIQKVEPQADKPKKEEKKAEEEVKKAEKPKLGGPKVVGKVDLEAKKVKKEEAPEVKKEEPKPKEEPVAKKEEPKEEPKPVKKGSAKDEAEFKKTEMIQIDGPKVVGKIDLPVEQEKKDKKENKEDHPRKKRRRKRIIKPDNKMSMRDGGDKKPRGKGKQEEEAQVSEKEIQEKIKATMAKLAGTDRTAGKSARAKQRRQKQKEEQETQALEAQAAEKVLQVTEFISVSELASMMGVSPTELISKCMELNIIVSINQRLDAEIIELLAEEYEYEVKFTDVSEAEEEEEVIVDDPKDLEERAPIVTVMGHVDHGKTSLLDYIRKANVVAGEAGGITQHIGAYEVITESGKRLVFLDTPGHEAFTAMRARGAKATDVAIIVIAADDNVMPQTKEAISHAQAAGVPMVFAINKIDKDGANPDKIKEELANMDLLVEDWGGKYQSQDVSAKKGLNIEDLLEKVLLEAELLELKANPNRNGQGTIIEASLDKGRGYVATILVQTGTLKMGDVVVSGTYYGKVKAMFNDKGERIQEAGPSTPVQILGLNGAPPAGENFRVMDTDQEAKAVANKREQIIREQGLRTKKHITLDEIGRRLALGSFKELNLIVKGDVDGSIEALSDSLLKLSTDEVVVNIVHRAVGQITESDVLLASASDAIILGFQVRPSVAARKLAEKENIEIRLYSVIYKAIEEIQTAMEGMLEPTIEEKITGNLEIREVFKISKVGTIAGCQVIEGKVFRNSNVRVVRDGIVIYEGQLASLKRFKDDVKEVVNGQECGMNIKGFNDIKVGDIIEAYEETEVKRTLS